MAAELTSHELAGLRKLLEFLPLLHNIRVIGQGVKQLRIKDSDLFDTGVYARLGDDEQVVGQYTFTVNIQWESGTSFKGILDHANTAHRTYTFQDRNGTVADDTDLALKANLASPTFMGNPTAPTPTAGDNDTSLATTEFVTSAVATAGHDPVTVIDTASLNLTLVGQEVRGAVLPAGVDHNSLDNLTTGNPHTQYSQTSHTHTLSSVTDVTATATEVNYTTDVTSNIQAQLDAKAADAQDSTRVYNSANESIANTTVTALTFDSERYDTNSLHSTSSNTSRLTCQTAGKYAIFGTAVFDSNVVGFRALQLQLNGTTLIATQDVTSVANDTQMTICTQYNLAVNDYVELLVYQNSGGALNVRALSNYSPEFGMTRLGV